MKGKKKTTKGCKSSHVSKEQEIISLFIIVVYGRLNYYHAFRIVFKT
jgi:hypothetical protein